MDTLTIEPTYRVVLGDINRFRIMVVGAGGTGSTLALFLAGLAYHARQKGIQVELTLVDHDVVELKNCGRQAVSLQAAEAAHQHGTGEPTAHCLLCKSAGNAVAVAVAPGLPSVVAAARATVACTRASTSHAHFSPRLTRGPPTLLN